MSSAFRGLLVALRNALAVVLLAQFVLAVVAVVQIWPAVEAASRQGVQQGGSPPPPMPGVHLLWLFDGVLEPESTFLLVVLLLGAVGASVHALTSMGDYLGNGTFSWRWTWWYLFRVPLGMGIALVFYLLLRGGLISADASTGVINPYAIAALAGLAGLFSKAAADKLEEVWGTLFRVEAGGGDAKRADKLRGADDTGEPVEIDTTVREP